MHRKSGLLFDVWMMAAFDEDFYGCRARRTWLQIDPAHFAEKQGLGNWDHKNIEEYTLPSQDSQIYAYGICLFVLLRDWMIDTTLII